MEHRTGCEETYNLGRDFLASARRLNLQHYLWKETCGFTIHPSIPIEDPAIKVAEVGTGTAIWLLELAKALPPTAQLVGFDVSADQFPPSAWLPSNVSLATADASKPPPAHLQGQFDVVHLRLFTFVVDGNDPTPYIQHCMALLRPGGYLQWDEYDPLGTGIVRSVERSSVQNITAMLAAMVAQKPCGWISELATWFFRNGLSVKVNARFSPPEYLLKPFTEMVCVIHVEHAELLAANGQSDGEKRVRDLLDRVLSEAREGVYVKHMLQVVVGRKPGAHSRIWSGHKL